MPVTTRAQNIQQQIDNQQLTTQEDPPILAPEDPPAGKPHCYLVWGRFMTDKEYRDSSGKTAAEVDKMMMVKPTKMVKPKAETTHGIGWNTSYHYMSIGGQCGQSCPCCRAGVFKSGVDPDAKWGACNVCLH